MGSDDGGDRARFTERRRQWRKELRELGLSSAEAERWVTGYRRYRQKRNELVAARSPGAEMLPPKELFSEKKNPRRRARYKYAVSVLRLDPDTAARAAQSATALMRAAPGHAFPAALIERRKRPATPGPSSERYRACRELGMPSTMASEGCGSDAAFERMKREWAEIRRLRGENDKERETG